MSKKNESIELVPELRFPEFETDGEWRLEAVDNLSETVTAGGTPSTKKEDYWGGNIRWMNSGELNLKIVREVEGRITDKGLKNSSTKIIPENCVLIGLAGQGKTRGTVAINKVELCTNQSIASIFPNDEVFDSGYLYHNLDNRYNELRELSAGGQGRGGLNLKIIKEIKIPIPPEKTEQQKIAATLTSLDNLIAAENEKLKALQAHKKGLLQQLFPEKGEKVPKLRFGEFSGDWEETTLGEIGSPLMCKRIFKEQTSTDSTNSVPFYKIGTFGKVADAYISVGLFKEFKSKFSYPKVGDILISASGTIGRLVVYDGADAYYQDSNIVWLGHDESNVLNSFLYYYYLTVNWQTSDGGIIKRLYNSNLKEMVIVYPKDKKEQLKIACCLSSLDNTIADQSEIVDFLKDHKRGLMQQMFPKINSNNL